MKTFGGWSFPDGEEHLITWMNATNDIADGRQRYQGRKQIAALKFCTNHRVAVSVGSHVGLWAFYLAKQFETVHCFEPVAAHRECFAVNVTAPNVTLHACALGEKDGSVSMTTAKTSSGDSYVNGHSMLAAVGGPGDIPMKRLDEFNFQDVGFIKIDVEGGEEAVILGGLETIKRCRPVMIVEQKGGEVTHFGLKKDGAIRLLESVGMKALCKPISGDWIMGW